MVNLARKLKKSRLSKGLSLREVAEKIKSSSGYVHDMENGRRNPSEKMLKKLERVLFK